MYNVTHIIKRGTRAAHSEKGYYNFQYAKLPADTTILVDLKACMLNWKKDRGHQAFYCPQVKQVLWIDKEYLHAHAPR